MNDALMLIWVFGIGYVLGLITVMQVYHQCLKKVHEQQEKLLKQLNIEESS